MNDTDKNENTTPVNPPAPTQRKIVSDARKFHVGKNVVLFLLGVLAGIILMGAYTIVVEELKHPKPNYDYYTNRQTTPQKPDGEEQISEADLEKYVDAKDCSTLPAYSSYEISLSRLKMKTISLDASLITAGKEAGTNYIRWTTLPKVLDYECKELKLSDIKAGDIINVYTLRKSLGNTDSDYASDTKMVQRANKR